MSKPKHYWETSEFKQLREEWYAKLAEQGFEDIERVAPDGDISTQFLDGPLSSTKQLTTPELLDEHRFPGGPNKFHVTPRMERFLRAERVAIRAFQHRDNWELCVAFAAFADGYSEREIASMMGRSRGKVRSLLEGMKAILPN